MLKIKANDIVALRKILASDPKKEVTMLKSLAPHLKDCYQTILFTDWVTQEEESAIFRAGSQLLFPDHPAQHELTRKEIAKIHMNGIYRVFIRIPSIYYLIKIAYQLWKLNFSHGRTELKRLSETMAELIIHDCPELDIYQRKGLCGYIEGLLEMAETKNPSVMLHDDTDAPWKWIITWDAKESRNNV